MIVKLETPTCNIKHFSISDVFLRGDDISVEQYCEERGWTLDDYTVETQRFSNNGALLYGYYDEDEEEWKTEFGFSKVVVYLMYEEAAV